MKPKHKQTIAKHAGQYTPFNARLQVLLAAAGWQGRYTLHSFRVGAATTAASLGFPDYLMQAMGRWSSDAYKVYIKLPQQRLKVASKSLATTTSLAPC